MSMSFGLATNIDISTSQKLTPQMQQAIRLLQMSSVELEQEVQLQLEKNPMLERDDGDLSDQLQDVDEVIRTDDKNQVTNDSDDSSFDRSSVTDTLDKLESADYDDSSMDVSWDNVYTSAPSSLATRSDEDLMAYDGGTSSTIQDHVRWQINFKNISDVDKVVADYLIDSMDDAGFITLDIDELYNNLFTITSFYQWENGIEKEEIIMVLKMIQSCEPLGVGARGLSECLSIQFRNFDKDTPYLAEAKQLLDHCEHLQTNNINALLAATTLSLTDIQPALELIRGLNPSPGQSFTDNQTTYGFELKSYDIPDVLVNIYQDEHEQRANKKKYSTATNITKQIHQEEINAEPAEEITWHVCLNPETLPKLKINQEYVNLIKRGDDSSDNVYLRENLSDAKLFLRSIQERNLNLLKVVTCIVKRQEQFLLHGATSMQPLILKEVADEVGLHESTVSRLTTSKSMLTPQGLYTLKYFFSSSVSGNKGDVSSTAIRAIIEGFIHQENPKKPLSDSAIVKLLNEQGIDIARRTVAKYRESMNIGSSTQRKKKY